MSLLVRLFGAALFLSFASASYAELKLNGVAVHNQLSQDQFIAAVYATNLSDDARALLLDDSDKALEVRVVADTLYARRFKRMWIEGIAINAGAKELEQHAQQLADFANLLRVNLQAGDILRIERHTDNSTNFYLNGYALGAVPDDRFFDLLLRTWVGPVPLSSQFKEQILAGGDVNGELRTRLERVAPSSERVSAVTEALSNTTPTTREKEAAASPTASASDTASPSAPQETPEPESAKTPQVAQVTQQEQESAAESDAQSAPERRSADSMSSEEALFAEQEGNTAVTAEDLLAEQVYISKLTRWTSGFVEYPRAALRNNLEGTVRLVVTIRRNGKLEDVQFLEKSEHDHLNRAAIKAAKSASPYPAVPDAIGGETFMFSVPLVFRLR